MNLLPFLIILILVVLGAIGFIVIRDLLFLISFFEEQYKIKIYNKNYKKYEEEKKLVRDKRLQQEQEIRKQFDLEQPQYEEEIIVGFAKPQGKHTEQEFMRNKEKYQKIAATMKKLGTSNFKSMYWRAMTSAATHLSNGRGRER